ncbi:MAG: methylated-DNA--[protein]-cysteine S-methyltransferase [Planctomycetota bacterium]
MKNVVDRPVTITVFKTKLGPMGVVESRDRLLLARIGSEDLPSLERVLFRNHAGAVVGSRSKVADLLIRYAKGEIIDFSEILLDETVLSPFRRKVTEFARRIPYGKTSTYSELAAQAGSPNAYRAAGSTMANNPWTIVVPCHRVLAKGGIGGYSAPQGLDLKKHLLHLEAQHVR